LITEWEKFIYLVFFSSELEYFFGYFRYIAFGDGTDGNWYNNAEAVGHQLAPMGIHKYYDMYSWTGFSSYLTDRILAFIYILISPFTLFIPLNFWIAWLIQGQTFDGWWKFFIPSCIGHFFRVKLENDFLMG
jgi:hypothetical protein